MLTQLTALEQAMDAAEPYTIAVMRIATGIFLIHGVWDNIVDPQRMQEFIGFMRAAGFTNPDFWAPFSIHTQFLAGLLLVAGFAVRLGGIITAVTFIVGLVMVHWSQSLRLWWPALALVLIGLHLTARGGGPLSADALLARLRRRPQG